MTEIDTAPVGRSRLALVLLFAIFAAPVILAWLVFYVFPEWQPSGTTNHGQLVEPVRPLPGFELETVADGTIDETFLRGKWTLVYWSGGACDDDCMQQLFTLRQVRLAQGKNIDRLQRLMLWAERDGTGGGTDTVQQHYPGLVIAPVTAAEHSQLLEVFALDDADVLTARRAYLVDPLGNLMMLWQPGDDPAGIIKDLEKLLKWSGLG
ncbi:MAG: hypothetical protein J5I92_10530 [Thiogranum sp.]|nr:hypothetical protein [Thiogranum sp.]